MKNDTIAGQFELLADLLEIDGANPFRIRAYRGAARTISSASESLAQLAGDGEDLTQFQGIGKDLARQIVEYVATGQLASLEELRAKIPPGVLDMLRIPGVGPKK
ncbi:MAG: helix-hairpin-helix domain-containing protein, partial [Planctomycetaceae bacterium]